jgi:hypothetical protein
MPIIQSLPSLLVKRLNREFGENNWKFVGFDVDEKGYVSDYADIKIGDKFLSFNVTHYYGPNQ